MKIIIVTPAVPHPFADTAARWCFVLIKELLARGHRVVCFCATGENPGIIAEAQEFLGGVDLRIFALGYQGSSFVRKVLSLQRPFSETYYARGLHHNLRMEMAQGYDVLHLEQLWTGWFGYYPRALLNVHHFEIIDQELVRPSNLAEWKTLNQMKRGTRRILNFNTRIRVFSKRLLHKAKTINPSVQCSVVPFALEVSRYPVVPVVNESVAGIIGSMHWLPSRSAGERLLTRIWPSVRAEIPTAKLLVAGWNARRHLEQFARVPGVEILDSVAHPADFFSKIATLVYPLPHGSGMKVKVMESMAFGVPVVTTSQGVEGLSGTSGLHYMVSETDEEIAADTVRLLRSHGLRLNVREAGRKLIEESYSPSVVVNQMLDVYREIVSDV